MSDELWYYSNGGGTQEGPIPFTKLRELAENGQLRPDDMVWSPGMASWSAARGVQGVLPGPIPPPLTGPAALPRFQESDHGSFMAKGRALLQRAAHGGQWNHRPGGTEEAMPAAGLTVRLLERLEGFFSKTLLDHVSHGARRAGRLAYFAAAPLFLLFYTALAIKVDSMQIFFIALLTIAPVAFVGRYCADSFLVTGTRLIPTLPSRIYTRAFLRCTALLFFLAALYLTVDGFYELIKNSDWGGFGLALGLGAVCVYVGGITLSPESLSIEIDEKTGAGEEALGILAFLMKLLLRLSPIVFGVGACVGAGAAIYFSVQLFSDDFVSIAFPVVGTWSVLDVTIGVLALGFVPFLFHLTFVLCYLLIDVLRAVLKVPGELGAIRQGMEAQCE